MFVWKNQLGSRSRAPFLLLVKGEEIKVYDGEQTTPGWFVLKGTDFVSQGKWSYTTYRLVLAPGVRPIAGHMGFETNRFAEGLAQAVGGKTPDTWAEMAQALGVSVPSAMSFLRAFRPKAAAKLDEVEQQLEALEETSASGNDATNVVVSFGGPSNRQIADGYWVSPKEIPGTDARISLVDPALGWVQGNIEIIGAKGSVSTIVYAPGYHGGYYTITVLIV